MKKKLKKAISIFQWLLTTVLVLVVLLLIFTVFNPVKSFQIFRVMSGSMEPKIKVGSVVFVRGVKPEILKENDVITYTSLEDPNISITHRLTEIEEKEGKTVFKTQGDANNSEDIAEVSPSQIKGKVIFSLPLLGYLSVWIRRPLGFGLLVILPAILIIISEILNIKKTIEKEVEKKYAKHEKHKKSKPTNLLLFFFLIGIGFFQIKPTNAYFSDVVVVEGNTFSMAADWTTPPPPAPAPNVVINEVYYHGDSSVEWIELYNAGGEPVDLNGWSISDNYATDVLSTSSLILPPDSFAVVVGTYNSEQIIAPGAIKIILGNAAIGNGLADDGDRVILKTPGGVEVDEMSYGIDTYAFDPSVPGVAEGHSISRVIKGVDTDSDVDWMDTHTGSFPAGPNPGTNPHPSETASEPEGEAEADEGAEPGDVVAGEESVVEEPLISEPSAELIDEESSDEEIIEQSEEMVEPTKDQLEEISPQNVKSEEEQDPPLVDESQEKPQEETPQEMGDGIDE